MTLQASLRVLSAALVLALLALAPLASRADGAASDFPGTLYLSSATAAGLGTSHTLATADAGIAPGAAPVALRQAGGTMPTGGVVTYVYTVVVDGYEGPASSPSNAVVPIAGNQQIQVTLPNFGAAATVRLYRQRSTGTPSTRYLHLVDVPGTQVTYVDVAPDPAPTAAQLAQPYNRPAANVTGYYEFAPGTAFDTAATTGPSTPSTTPTGKGWIVQTPGPITFDDGNWSFEVQTKAGAVPFGGEAYLVVGLWKVTLNGSGSIATSSPIIDPTTAAAAGTTRLHDVATVKQVTHTVPVATPTVLAAGEYLYVEFWRWQKVAFSSGSNAARQVVLYAHDGYAKVRHPTADDAAPGAFAVTAPSSGSFIRNGQALQSNPTDATPGSGLASVEYFYCLAVDPCGFAGTRVSIASVASSPWSATWSGQPADGTYQVFARATDNVGNAVDSTIVPVTVDNTAPDTSFSSTPSDPSSGSPSFGLASDETGTFECNLDGGGFAACPTPYSPGPLASGSHTLQVRAVDGAGNLDASPVSFTWTVDATAPSVGFTSTPASPSSSASATFAFSTNEGTLTCSLDGGAFTACSSPRTPTGLADGSHTFTVRATDSVGNAATAAHTWTVDTTAPRVTVSGPAPRTNTSGASFTFSVDETATVECSLDGGSWSACSSPHSSAVGEGAHTFVVRATDSVGHVGTASHSWTVDTVPPRPPGLDSPVGGHPTTSLRLTAVYVDSDSSGTIEFRVCWDAACTALVAGGSSHAVTAGTAGFWNASGAFTDGTYYWQARAVDLAGNTSAWTAVASFVRDTVVPAAPGGFGGTVGRDGLTLSWAAPAGATDIANYVVFVDGKRWRAFGGSTFQAKIGMFDAGDSRTFTVVALDHAGNESAPTQRLVGVPDLVGLPVTEAKDAVETRGLKLGNIHHAQSAFKATPRVVSQTPAAPGLARWGSVVEVVVGDAVTPDVRPLVKLSRGRVCGRGGLLSLQVQLQSRSTVTLRVLNARGRTVAVRRLGSLAPGVTSRRLSLPKALGKPGRYSLVVTAKATDRSGKATLRVTVPRAKRAGARMPGC